MRTFSSLIGRRVVTESGIELGRLHDVKATVTGTRVEVTALCVGRGGYLDRLGIPNRRHDEIDWASIVRIDGDRIVVGDPST
jgi:sporulation protein YlmC with PRC-barrel domain